MDKFINQWRELEKGREADSQFQVESVKDATQEDSSALSYVEDSHDNAIDNSQPTSTSTSGNTRKFMAHWVNKFKWIHHDKEANKVFCAVCMEAYNVLKIKHPISGYSDQLSYATFVTDGFANYKKAIERFNSHEKCKVHRHAVLSINSKKQNVNVFSMVSTQSSQERKYARLCLLKIFETIRFLTIQGLAIRGHSEENSNFIQLLYLRSNDCPILKAWMDRSKYRWISHEIINEVISLMSLYVQRELQKIISKPYFYAMMVDETADISRKEQMSINIRVVDNRLNIQEIFLGFYECPCTTSETLCDIVIDALRRYELSLNKCRGQCYDGANNVSGWISGLQTRIRELECRALYTHCAGHNLNLSSQDAMSEIPQMADLFSNMKCLIKFIRASPKRVQIFKNIQICELGDDDVDEDDGEEDDGETPHKVTSLKPFCPTRWCVRVKSLKSVRSNYKFIIQFCDQVGLDKNDVDAGVKARGFSSYMNKFETYLILEIAIAVLEPVEQLNETLQATTINFKSVIRRVDILKASLQAMRTNKNFNILWNSTEQAVNLFDLEYKVPILPRKRKIPSRFDESSNTAHFPDTPKDKYRPIYFSVIDQLLTSLNTRFDSETYEILVKLEDFATQKCEFEEIACYLYKDGQSDFDKDRLILHRNMFFDVVKQKNIKLNVGLTGISMFLQKSEDYRELFSEYTKFIQLLLTYPQTVCVAKRSFSDLKRLKTYLRGSMTQKHLNDLAILHIHKKITSTIDMDSILDEFILRGGSVRGNTFAMKSEK